jgi:hypothetical protein
MENNVENPLTQWLRTHHWQTLTSQSLSQLKRKKSSTTFHNSNLTKKKRGVYIFGGMGFSHLETKCCTWEGGRRQK